VNHTTGKILVNYDGWSHNFDAWLDTSSSKIAPFKKISPPYTGQKRYALRDWEFTIQETQEMINKVGGLLDSDLVCTSAYDTVQFVRGEMIILVDSLLQMDTFNDNSTLDLVV